MINMGFDFNVVMFIIVICGWCSIGRMERVIKVFENMCEYGIFLNLKIFEILIWGYGEVK